MRILVVEDEPDLADAVASGLRREGYAVDVADDGAAAYSRLGVHEYDLVCLDLGLPDVDGMSLCRDLAEGAVGDPATRGSSSPPAAPSTTGSPASTPAPTTTS